MLWFNPPYSQNVKTNVGAKFLKLISKHFPKSNPLSKIINRRKVKMSYKCTENMSKIISAHNSEIIREQIQEEERKCSCKEDEECPLGGHCLIKDIIYQATVTPLSNLDEGDQPTPTLEEGVQPTPTLDEEETTHPHNFWPTGNLRRTVRYHVQRKMVKS